MFLIVLLLVAAVVIALPWLVARSFGRLGAIAGTVVAVGLVAAVGMWLAADAIHRSSTDSRESLVYLVAILAPFVVLAIVSGAVCYWQRRHDSPR